MKKLYFLFSLLSFSIVFATIPAGYYDDAAGLSGNDLRLALHGIIDDHNQRTYEQVWTAFETTDIMANGKIWDMYTGIEFTFSDDQQTIGSDPDSCYNREHSWPKSWANEAYPMYTDLYHLYPTQQQSNTERSNLPYGEVDATVTYTSPNGTKKGNARSGLGYVGTVFEPIDEYKGDLARTYFYISTRYYTEDVAWDSYGMTDLCELKDWAVSMLLNWHHNDPVSQKELDRIEAIYAIQENRNPFIDHPEYVDSIWNAPSESFEAPTAQTASSVQSDRFTANWSEVSEATGYKLYISENSNFSNHITNYGPKDTGNNLSEIVSGLSSSITYYYRVKAYKTGEETGYSNVITVETAAPSGAVDSTKIFFSEYIEGSSYNKALEIYNGADADIDLSKITIKLYTNGGTSPYRTLSLSGTLVNGEVYVIAHDNANATILASTDLTNATVMIYNGNDVLELYYDDTLVDRIGEVGSDAYYAQDVTLVRKAEVLNANTTFTVSEWNNYEKDETSYLGSHNIMTATGIIPSDGQTIFLAGAVGSVYPNPCNPAATMPLYLDQAADVTISLHDIHGRKCRDIMHEHYARGNYTIPVDISGLPSGVYVLHITIGKSMHVQKIVLTK